VTGPGDCRIAIVPPERRFAGAERTPRVAAGTSRGEDRPNGAASRIERTASAIRLTPGGLLCRGRRIPCTVGRGGLTDTKREGDGATPRGQLRIVATLYRADWVPRPVSWAHPIGPGDLWSDDPRDPHYNRPVRAPHPFSHECLRRGDRLYDIVLVTDWNACGAPGAGSAIFLHRWRRPGVPTEGCIAMAPRELLWLARHAEPGTLLLV
jgi:L,D-peptidoglycan transpeptidase YkuD (ErfK/YbiS/YcfS/YnhG family)